MRWRTAIWMMGTLPLAAAVNQSIAQQRKAADPAALESRTRFSQPLEIGVRDDKKMPIKIDIRHWSVGERQRIATTKLRAFDGARTLTIYQLRAGELTTVVNGKKVQRQEGEFWTLRPGEMMTLETGNDTAVIETIVIDQR